MRGLYTNRNVEHDFVHNGITANTRDGENIFIASAFFTDSEVVNELTVRNCHVRMVVRLGFPTNPNALRAVLKNKKVEARFYTNNSFHPKLYIFGDKVALVGSANLTKTAILTNQEVVVEIDSEDPRFSELINLFADYWDESEVLTEEAITKYENIYNKNKDAVKNIGNIEEEVRKEIGDVVFSNINRGKKKRTKESIFLDSYRKSYQESVSAFNYIKDEYLKYGRKVDETKIPLRLEIDSFFSFVRDIHATHEIWRESQVGWSDKAKQHLASLIKEWHQTAWPHFENRIVNTNYPLIIKVFGSSDTIEKSTIEEIVDALVVLHSFRDRLRFYKGGLESLKTAFINNNNPNNVKNSLIHLLYGKGDIIRRMADLIFSGDYKLNEFGQANVQELVGWVSADDLPVINGRTTKVLRYFGFKVRQL